MNRRRSIAIHEASHLMMAYLFNERVSETAVMIDKKTNDTTGEMSGEFLHGLTHHKDSKGKWFRKFSLHQIISVVAAGYIGEGLFNSREDFWQTHRQNILEKAPDLKIIRQCCREENISQLEVDKLLIFVRNYLSIPSVWAFINYLADYLIEHGTIIGLPHRQAGEKAREIIPTHDAQTILHFIYNQAYADDRNEKIEEKLD